MYTGKKTRLRAYDQKDLGQVLAFNNDQEIKLLLNNGLPYPSTHGDQETWYKNLSASNDKYRFAIESLATGSYIGGCGINHIDWLNRIATIGIFIGDKTLWGMGMGTDAMHVLIQFIFQEMNLNKVRLYVYDFNQRAIECYSKCGFQVEARLRSSVYKQQQYSDALVMGLLREEYKGGYHVHRTES